MEANCAFRNLEFPWSTESASMFQIIVLATCIHSSFIIICDRKYNNIIFNRPIIFTVRSSNHYTGPFKLREQIESIHV